MDQQAPRHEKIRFRREEIADLGNLPSSAGFGPCLSGGNGRLRRPLRRLARFGGGLLGLFVLLVAGVYVAGVSGIGADRMRAEAEKVLDRAAGPDLDATVGAVSIGFGGSSFIALDVSDVALRAPGKPVALVEGGAVKIGLRLLPLLRGEVSASGIDLSQARIALEGLPSSRDSDWAAKFRNADGLLDPDLVVPEVFRATHRVLDLVQPQGVRSIAVSDIELRFPQGGQVQTISVRDADAWAVDGGSVRFAAELEADGRPVAVEASAARDAAADRISGLSIRATVPQEAAGEPSSSDHRVFQFGGLDLSVTGSEGRGQAPSTLETALSLKGASLDLDRRGVLAGDIEFAGVLAPGSRKIDVRRLRASIGRSVLDFYGAIGPRPRAAAPDDRQAYRFDLISARSLISPEDSPEAALETYLRLSGIYLVNERNLTIDEILAKPSNGEMLGTASIQFAPGVVPGGAAAFSVKDMPVAQVKQLWPWFSASPARRWVMEKLFGGTVREGRLNFSVLPGRLGNGIPLTENEVFGSFSVAGTRFDTAGLIPPVRDAVGVVDFRGNDVDVTLDAGTVFLADGRTVAASNGRMKIADANRPPVIGRLEIDVAGDAPAIAELASYDPINALRSIGYEPGDFSGAVEGHVSADIPLQRGINPDTLNWLVTLDYKNLALARPVDGQTISEAEGTIAIDPQKAVISARTKLSGVAAEIDTTLPIRNSGVPRTRIVRATLDDRTRNRIIPGIADLVSGPTRVELEALGPGRQKVKADLKAAEIDLPWVGWTKGRGVDASLGFVMETGEGRTTLSDFDLSGQTFQLAGTVRLDAGGLSEANLSRVRLNRGDDVAVTVRRSSSGIAVDVSGQSFDARSVVRQFTQDSSTATSSASKASDSGRVTVAANVASLTGFGDERLSNVDLRYDGSGDTINALRIAAATRSGGSVEIANGGEGGARTMRVRSADAGAILRFLDIYPYMQGGRIEVALSGPAKGALSGRIDARDFWVVNEPRLRSIVSSAPAGEPSLNDAVRRDIDTSRVQFDRGFAEIEKGAGYLRLRDGVLRGSTIGSTFQGMLYDRNGNMDMTGTFMPAYGINRIFGEIPVLGALLGNGRDRGLIGVTFKLEGKTGSPRLTINPLSAIAPGIFRSIFEFQ
ncbi:MAG: AsmA-like C-terminal region-containing protein [Rhizobiaceae bacterium]